jgi:cellulose synthase/poly-beta-1,6-N-acetylglucosamine synthase-like glycosyltransferase
VRESISPDDVIHVVADHCTDETARIASQRGARVHIRQGESVPGKGFALSWWVRRMGVELDERVVVVLDADSRTHPEFANVIRGEFARGTTAIQGLVQPLAAEDPLSQVAALSDMIEQKLYNRIRSRLGWSVRLRGTGIAISGSVLRQVGQDLQTCVEDAELTVLLAAAHIPIRFVPQAVVFDPKPDSTTAARIQRARWLRGDAQLLQRRYPDLIRLVLQGPAGWSLLSSILLKPRAFFVPVKILLACAALTAALHQGGAAWLLAGTFVTLVMVEMLAAAVGFWVFLGPMKAARLAVQIPRYLVLWIRSAAVAVTSDGRWVRTPRWNPEEPLRGWIVD